MLYVDDKLPKHPKIFRAGESLGPNGPAQALALYMDGLAYAREHLTDGFLPDRFVCSCGLVETPQSVAKALSSRSVRLWHRVTGGYRIHDYHDWNRKASDIKKKRAEEREKKRHQRNGKNGNGSHLSLDVSPGDKSRTSCARASTYHVPRTTNHGTQLELVPPRVVPPYVSTKAPALSRRDSLSLLKTPEDHDVATTAVVESGDVCPTLRDRARTDRGGSDDRRLGVESADQGSPGAAEVRAATKQRTDSRGDVSGRAGTLETGGTAARVAADVPETAGDLIVAAAVDGSGISDGGSEGERLLRATITHLREQLRDDVARPARRRNRQPAALTQPDSGTDRGVESRAATATMDPHTARLGADRGMVKETA